MRSRTFEGDEEIKEWIRKISDKEASDRELEDTLIIVAVALSIIFCLVAIGVISLGG